MHSVSAPSHCSGCRLRFLLLPFWTAPAAAVPAAPAFVQAGVDAEQIEAAMQLLGLTGTDLLNPQPVPFPAVPAAGFPAAAPAVLFPVQALPARLFP